MNGFQKVDVWRSSIFRGCGLYELFMLIDTRLEFSARLSYICGRTVITKKLVDTTFLEGRYGIL